MVSEEIPPPILSGRLLIKAHMLLDANRIESMRLQTRIVYHVANILLVDVEQPIIWCVVVYKIV